MRESLIKTARDMVAGLFPGLGPSRSCLYDAFATLHVLRENKIRAVLQAGNMSWPMVDPAFDDGISPTHWSYVWEPHSPLSEAAVANGHLPEIHIWVGIIDTQEIVDISVRGLKDAAIKAGFDWTAPDPPDFLWARQLPRGVSYKPLEQATKYAAERIIELAQECRPWLARTA